MRTALIDNASLTATERLLGTASVKNLNNIEHDIACFEKLLTSILFFDDWQMVDDYKAQYANRRKEKFSFINPLAVDDADYEFARQESSEFAKKQMFELDGAEPVGNVLNFFEQLSLSPQMRWDIFVSSEYLTLSYLVDDPKLDKYEVAAKVAAFGNEFSDANRTSDFTGQALMVKDHSSVFDGEAVADYLERKLEENPDSKGLGYQDTFERIVFGYGWAAERSKFYELLAQKKGFSPVLSPLRDAYSLSVLNLNLVFHEERFLAKAGKSMSESIIKAGAVLDMSALVFRLPFFTAWFLNEVENTRDAISYALEVRDRKEFSQFRDSINKLAELSFAEKKEEIGKINKELGRISSKILEEYVFETANGPSISVGGTLVGPSIGISNKIPDLFAFGGKRRHPIVRSYRSLARDLMAVERLGKLHEKTTKLVRKHKDAVPANVSTVPKFMRKRANEYGKPAK